MKKYNLYKISADGGKTWTEQWLTPAEAASPEYDECIVILIIKCC